MSLVLILDYKKMFLIDLKKSFNSRAKKGSLMND